MEGDFGTHDRLYQIGIDHVLGAVCAIARQGEAHYNVTSGSQGGPTYRKLGQSAAVAISAEALRASDSGNTIFDSAVTRIIHPHVSDQTHHVRCPKW